MTEPKQKYRVVYAPSEPTIAGSMVTPTPKVDLITWGAQLSALYETGYEIHTVRDTFVVMHLPEPRGSDYSNVIDLADVPPKEVSQHIAQGWEIASTSISTKFIRMVKRK